MVPVISEAFQKPVIIGFAISATHTVINALICYLLTN